MNTAPHKLLTVSPMKTGIQIWGFLDSRLRGNDTLEG